MDSQPIVFFDGVCNLCNKSVQFIIKRDKKKKFLFASLQGKQGQALLKKSNDLPSDALNSFLLLEGERLYTHSTGALRVLKHLGGGWKILYSFIALPKFLRDPIYNVIARNRYKWFGKKDQCMIPEPGMRERFLD